MAINFWFVDYKEDYNSEYKKGFFIRSSETFDENGNFIKWRYFTLDMKPFEYSDMVEVLYHGYRRLEDED